MNKKGLTLLEIIVSACIMALVMSGIANIFVAAKRHVLHSRSRITAAELGKYFLESLQKDVRQDTWDQSPVDPAPNNLLTIGEYKSTNNTFPDYGSYTVVSWLEEPSIGGITYYPVYKVENKDGLRKVKFTLVWTEPSP